MGHDLAAVDFGLDELPGDALHGEAERIFDNRTRIVMDKDGRFASA